VDTSSQGHQFSQQVGQLALLLARAHGHLPWTGSERGRLLLGIALLNRRRIPKFWIPPRRLRLRCG
jgi:hypothetical protein